MRVIFATNYKKIETFCTHLSTNCNKMQILDKKSFHFAWKYGFFLLTLHRDY